MLPPELTEELRYLELAASRRIRSQRFGQSRSRLRGKLTYRKPADDQFVVAGSSGFEQLAGSGVEQRIGLSIKALPSWYLEGKPKPPTSRKAFITWKHYDASSPLVASGLLGPVMIYWAQPLKL